MAHLDWRYHGCRNSPVPLPHRQFRLSDPRSPRPRRPPRSTRRRPAPIIKALEREGWTLTDILVTHHHGDHVGGIAELKQKYNCRVVAPTTSPRRSPMSICASANGDVVKVGGLLARVLETPGHTLDHISYVFDNDKALFAADTLFSIGCGRVFEGNYPMMWDSLLKLRALPDDFKLYCGHEYTAANVKFALTVEPDNAALKARAEEVTRLRAANKPTIPTLLGEEKKANVFLRADEPSVAAKRAHEGRQRRRSVRRIARTQEQILMLHWTRSPVLVPAIYESSCRRRVAGASRPRRTETRRVRHRSPVDVVAGLVPAIHVLSS
jgi:hydroxyacylglutathione hydrolase